ncbi:MAG: ISH6 family transposase [Thermoplasmata archaeon]
MPKSQLEWSVDWSEPITLAALTQRIFEEGLGRADLVALLEDRDRELCDELCGSWYHPRRGSRFRRAGRRARRLGTRFGKIVVRVRRVVDTVTGEVFAPLWRDILLDGGRVYQPDVIALAEQFTERMSYRDAREELGKVVYGVPSPRTVNRRVIEDGNLLNEAIRQREMAAGSVIPDGTKLHAKGGKLHDVNITLATAPGRRPRLRCLTVGAPWAAHRETLDRTSFENAEGASLPPTVVSDQERGLAEAMTPPGGHWQPDHVHIVRNTGYSLWEDGLKSGPEKWAILRTVSGLLAHLRNSVAYHLPRGETEAVAHRIRQTTKEFRRLATRLWNNDYERTAILLARMSEPVTTFAALALQGITVPWNSNVVERVMGTVSKRAKHKWMSWTTAGSQGLLTLLVTRAVEPRTHEQFWRQKLYSHLSHLPHLGIEVTRLESGSRS